jgi:hypothetical protein
MKGVNNMNSYHIKKHRINKLHIPETYDINKIQLGIPVTANEAAIVGLKEVGHIVLPSGKFGPLYHPLQKAQDIYSLASHSK